MRDSKHGWEEGEKKKWLTGSPRCGLTATAASDNEGIVLTGYSLTGVYVTVRISPYGRRTGLRARVVADYPSAVVRDIEAALHDGGYHVTPVRSMGRGGVGIRRESRFLSMLSTYMRPGACVQVGQAIYSVVDARVTNRAEGQAVVGECHTHVLFHLESRPDDLPYSGGQRTYPLVLSMASWRLYNCGTPYNAFTLSSLCQKQENFDTISFRRQVLERSCGFRTRTSSPPLPPADVAASWPIGPVILPWCNLSGFISGYVLTDARRPEANWMVRVHIRGFTGFLILDNRVRDRTSVMYCYGLSRDEYGNNRWCTVPPADTRRPVFGRLAIQPQDALHSGKGHEN